MFTRFKKHFIHLSTAIALSLTAPVAFASPIDVVMNGFSFGMTKDQVMNRVKEQGGNLNSTRCPIRDENTRKEVCWLTPAYKPAKFYGRNVESLVVYFYDDKLAEVGIYLDIGKIDKYELSRQDNRILSQLKGKMQGKPRNAVSNSSIWEYGDISFHYTARHKDDHFFPGGMGTYISMSITNKQFVIKPEEKQAVKPEKGWFSQFRKWAKNAI